MLKYEICQRYLSPKSPLSERGLAIASLKLVICSFLFTKKVAVLLRGEGVDLTTPESKLATSHLLIDL